jgi:hypothetical protein
MKRRPGRRRGGRRRSAKSRVLAAVESPPTELVDAVIKVVRYRFRSFRRAFGRNPKPDEPLFFVEGLSKPVLANRKQVMDQLSEAAVATGVELQQLLEFLRLR